MKKISIVTPTFNEEDNVELIIKEVHSIMKRLNFNYEHIIIDNNSNDRTQEIVKNIAKDNFNVKAIFNLRNFGWARSTFYGITQATGDAVILLAADFQDPPYLIEQFISSWEKGYKIVLGKKNKVEEKGLIKLARIFYYKLIKKISETNLTEDTIGFGLYDKLVIKELKTINDSNPYLRGLITEIGYPIHLLDYFQPIRKRGVSKVKLLEMYDIAINGIIKHSKLPLRFFTIIGFITSIFSIIFALIYFFYKILYWNEFTLGIAPIVIGLFALGSVNIFLLGLIGEYVLSILNQVRNIPIVYEKERINF